MGLLSEISSLRASDVGRLISGRMEDFARAGRGTDEELFGELCFCLLTANYTSEGGIRIQKEVGGGFLRLPRERLAMRLRGLGYRFPNARARYISEARSHARSLRTVLRSQGDGALAREWLADNVLGLGYKEASHFLRNIGYRDLAIIDFHIVDLLARHRLIRKPKSRSLGRKAYLDIERTLGKLASKTGLCQGELDLYLWYMETGKVLK
jgi:N-glycosylase/DNA lyase